MSARTAAVMSTIASRLQVFHVCCQLVAACLSGVNSARRAGVTLGLGEFTQPRRLNCSRFRVLKVSNRILGVSEHLQRSYNDFLILVKQYQLPMRLSGFAGDVDLVLVFYGRAGAV